MRTALTLAAVLLVLVAGASAQSDPVQGKVSFSVTTASVRDTAHTRVDLLLLWNLNERALPIGHAVKSCIKAGSGGPLGGGVMTCTFIMSLPLGKVAALGQVHNIMRYTLVITGGTGIYEGASGAIFVARAGDGVRRLVFTL